MNRISFSQKNLSIKKEVYFDLFSIEIYKKFKPQTLDIHFAFYDNDPIVFLAFRSIA